jgi:hypothetical protein
MLGSIVHAPHSIAPMAIDRAKVQIGFLVVLKSELNVGITFIVLLILVLGVTRA